MKYFGELLVTTNDYELIIREDPSVLGARLIISSPDIEKNTVSTYKKLASEVLGASIDTWQAEGKYFKSLIATSKEGYTLRIIEEVPGTGFYLYSFDKVGRPLRDDLQDTAQVCKEIAEEMYKVPLDAWREEIDL